MIANRLRASLYFLCFAGVAVLFRLFYWQVIAGESLAALAESQHNALLEIPASRGKILSRDNFDLVSNQPAFLAYAYRPHLTTDVYSIAKLLAPIVHPDPPETTTSAQLIETMIKDAEATLAARLRGERWIWAPLGRKLLLQKKQAIEQLQLKGIDFEPEQIRYYPEASMAANLVGFVGDNSNGNPQGYFGLEGYYDLELKGRPGIIRQQKDATGKPILVGTFGGYEPKNGRNLKLHLDRSIQRVSEIELAKAIERYGAKSGEIIIMDPRTGGIIALATEPKYNPVKYQDYDRSLYKNSTIADAYEPGSTFKVIVMSSALDADVIKPDTICDACDGPIEIGKYTIGTWNNKYYPDTTMTEVIQHSDNTGMVFVGNRLGKEKLYEYLQKFGIGSPTNIDLQEETVTQMKPQKKWGDIDVATASFGQGIAITAMQMITAVTAIANDGILMQPRVVEKIIGETTVALPPKPVRRVISKKAADEMTEMMVNAVQSGEAQWTKIPGYRIAGKTGTAQIAVAGHYDAEKTIASFVGFAPADDPKFVMLVKLREPTSSQWAADTAAPLWMRLARQLFLYYGIPPQE